MRDYISMASLYNEVIDCRMIQLELEFYKLTRSQLKNLAEYCYLEIKKLVDDIFYIHWEWEDKHIASESLYKKICTSDGCPDFGFEGYVLGDTVYNEKTFRKHEQKLFFDTNASREGMCVSADYIEVFKRYFSDVETPEQYKSALSSIFNESGRKKTALWRCCDISGLFYTCPYTNYPNSYRGEYDLKVALPCLGDNAVSFSEKLVEILVGIASCFSNVSGRITLSPLQRPGRCSGHMKYFGAQIIPKDTSHRKEGYFDIEWNPYYYVCGAEWFNIISPLQLTHIPNIVKDTAALSDVFVQATSNGNVIVRSNKDILKTDIADFKKVKSVLYNALYPGYSKIRLSDLLNFKSFYSMTKPRIEWEYIPIFTDEIEVDDMYVIFKHINAD